MKFQQLFAFEQHIKSSLALKQPARSYLLLHPDKEERKRLLQKLSKELSSSSRGTLRSFLDVEESSWAQVYERLSTPSLFEEEEILIWDGVKGLLAQEQKQLLHYVLAPSSSMFLLMGGDSSKGFSDLYQQAKQELVLLDLTAEKPWDKPKRLQQELMQEAKEEGKTLTPQALVKLVTGSGGDGFLLFSEFRKVCTYVGDKPVIEERDIQAICSFVEATGWQLADQVVWGDTCRLPSHVDLPFLMAFLGQVRFLLEQGKKIVFCLQERMSQDEIAERVGVKPFQLQKIMEKLRGKQKGYFEGASSYLYEWEMLLKGSSLSPKLLLDLLHIRLASLRK